MADSKFAKDRIDAAPKPTIGRVSPLVRPAPTLSMVLERREVAASRLVVSPMNLTIKVPAPATAKPLSSLRRLRLLYLIF
jgi:hypothetical protein